MLNIVKLLLCSVLHLITSNYMVFMKFQIGLFSLTTLILLLSYVDKVSNFIKAECLFGTVKYVSLEGGFWAI